MIENKRTIKLKNLIRKNFQEHKLSHSYLISGPENIGKLKLTHELAKILQCTNSKSFCSACSDCKNIDINNHLFVREIVPTSKGKSQKSNISINEIYELKNFLVFSAPENYYKIIIINSAEYLSVEAQNSLLKILEEPQKKSIIFLTTADQKKLLPTIHSRLQKISLTPSASSRTYLRSENDSRCHLSELLENGKINKFKKIFQSSNEEKIQLKKQIKKASEISELNIIQKFELAKNLAYNAGESQVILNILNCIFHDQLKSWILKSPSLLSKLDIKYKPIQVKKLSKNIRLIQITKDRLEGGFSPKLVLENLLLNL